MYNILSSYFVGKVRIYINTFSINLSLLKLFEKIIFLDNQTSPFPTSGFKNNRYFQLVYSVDSIVLDCKIIVC